MNMAYLKQLEQLDPENSGRILETVGCSTQMNSPTPMSLVATAKRPRPGWYRNCRWVTLC